jgi:CPA1 family monovalent cation:H+ antiporter
MDLLLTIFLLLACLLLSNIISHYIPSIPVALTQIALGIILSFVFKNISFEVEQEWFLLLFVAPLLYNDGRYFPQEELWKMKWSILGNSLILVLITTILGGYFIHWMIPAIPVAAAFALAAILSPTDPVAVNGLAKRIHIPENVLNLVRGESLINDASGLVAFKYATAAVVTGYFSLGKALSNFSYMFLVGAILGLVFALIISLIRYLLRKNGIKDVIFHSLLQILTPFGIFIITEFFHASGVIAVVIAGIVHSLMGEKTKTKLAEEQVLTENIWSIILFILNGIVFLLLGLNIPSLMIDSIADPSIGNFILIGYVIVIGLVILTIRFLWSLLLNLYNNQKNKTEASIVKTALFASLTGVRGAVTMAGILSLPYYLDNGNLFPERSLILFLTAGVILFTLIVATIFLPLLDKRQQSKQEDLADSSLSVAKNKLLLATIKMLEAEINEENEAAAYELINEYKRIFQSNQFQDCSPQNTKANQLKICELQLMALNSERKYINDLFAKEEIDEVYFETFEKSLNYREEALSYNMRQDTLFVVKKFIRGSRRFFRHNKLKQRELRLKKIRLVKDIQIKAAQAAVEALEKYSVEPQASDAAYTVILHYNGMINLLKNSEDRSFKYNEKTQEQKEELRIKAIDTERSEIRKMYETGEITKEQSIELRRYINNIESVVLYRPAE